MPIAVARGKVHLRVGSAMILPENRFHGTEFLYKVTPIGRGQVAKRFNAVPHGNLIDGKFLIFLPYQVVARRARSRQMLFQPVEYQGERWPFALYLPNETCNERTVEDRICFGHLRNGQDEF